MLYQIHERRMTDLVQIGKLSHLIEAAATALAQAATAAEILDAHDKATVAYDAAKLAARLSKAKDAHDTVIAACRKAQADALIIETRAQCRLADEYDAAQERGEVATQKHGGANIKHGVPKQNTVATVEDIGLTRKQVHDARIVRNAEKAKPGIVRKMLDEQLEAGEEPTRADVKRAVRNALGQKPKAKPKPRPKKTDPHKDKIIALSDEGLTSPEIGAEIGIHPRVINRVLQDETIRRQAIPDIDPTTLSLTAQQKLETAIRQHQNKLNQAFYQYVNDEIRKRMEETILPRHREEQAQAKKIMEARKGIMDKITFNKVRRALHPDSRKSISDKVLAEAFDTFMALEKRLLNEQDSPTYFQDIPDSYEGWVKM